MTGAFWHKMDGAARSSAPALMTLMLVLIGVMPFQLPLYGAVAPALPLIAIYYWAVHRPDLMPFTVVFGVGLLHDVLTAAPLGLNAAIFLVAHWLVIGQRRFLVGRSFLVLWWGFATIATLAAAMEWLAHSIYAATPMPGEPLVFRGLITIALFPAVVWIAIQVHRSFLANV
ncbi:MAG TPA: rod shape-determining protein MreD [Alphaproteobacteria bacterium]|nr:rod shape-determining protein MreD [Alphaproteobacteria bacterium]